MGSIQRPDATLDDRWEKQGEPVLLTGTHALVRMAFLRRDLDAAMGWNTGGFISGYRGSPLGAFDRELANHKARLASRNIVFTPGLNEDLAATAIWGAQSTGLIPGATVEGVFGIWYGKGPGVDRSGDVLRHANSAGTNPRGGVLALAGDDPASKSSTITSGCEFAFADVEMPVLDPANVAEVLEFGLKAIALSRFAGVWVDMKCVADTMDASASVFVDPARYATVEPRGLAPSPDGLHIRMPDNPLAQEARLRHFKLPHAVAFARANGFDRLVIEPPRARYGIVARG
ncbi:MAG TPA: indolepyruvate ferredoxin oxidoreductase family protein, partial [Acetobacteraceae bacterium]|nr:indolepyruvate ferredoxin oxidoreductase family protein [Acetobacteraceae bacterium]